MVKLCRVNKDDKNVGTVSEGVFSGRDFLSVKVSTCDVVIGETLAEACQIKSINTQYILI